MPQSIPKPVLVQLHAGGPKFLVLVRRKDFNDAEAALKKEPSTLLYFYRDDVWREAHIFTLQPIVAL